MHVLLTAMMLSFIDLLQPEMLDINVDELTHRETPQFPPAMAQDWLHHWVQITDRAPDTPQVPPEACAVTTPLVFSAWRHMLISHPHGSLVHFFLQGIASTAVDMAVPKCFPGLCTPHAQVVHQP